MLNIIDRLAGYIDTVLVVFFALLIAALALFSMERALYRLYLMLRIRGRWFPEGRFVLAWEKGEPRWDSYLAETLLPEIGDCTVVVPFGPDGSGFGDGSDEFERRVVNAFIDSPAEPEVIVFRPYLEYRKVSFKEALDTPGEPGERMLAAQMARLIELVDAQRDMMRLYI